MLDWKYLPDYGNTKTVLTQLSTKFVILAVFFLSLSLSLSPTHTHTHTHTLSLSLSLSPSPTHAAHQSDDSDKHLWDMPGPFQGKGKVTLNRMAGMKGEKGRETDGETER